MTQLNWLRKVLFDNSPQMIQMRSEAWHIRRIATQLANLVNIQQTGEFIIEQCREVLHADSACLYLLQNDGYYKMVSEHGCTEDFCVQWHQIPREWLPLLSTNNSNEALFFGTADELKHSVPQVQNLINRSGRHTISYIPLVVNSEAIG